MLTMPLGEKPKCHICKISFSVMWRKNDRGEIICNSCSVRPPTTPNRRSSCPFNLRKSTRAKSSRLRHAKTQQQTKGKSRRHIFKKTQPRKCFTLDPSITTTSYFFYRGQYYQVGDIVSVVGTDDCLYYAQVCGLVIDQYGGKSAYLHWLIPTRPHVDDYFDPTGYKLGEVDQLPRKMECINFICHAPEDFYKSDSSPYPVIPEKPDAGYIWTSIGQRVVHTPTQAEVFGTQPHETTDDPSTPPIKADSPMEPDDSDAKPDDSDIKLDDSDIKSDDGKPDDSDTKLDDSDVKTDDSPAKLDDLDAKTDDLDAKTDDSPVKPDDSPSSD